MCERVNFFCSCVCGVCSARVGRSEREMLTDYLFDVCVTLCTCQ